MYHRRPLFRVGRNSNDGVVYNYGIINEKLIKYVVDSGGDFDHLFEIVIDHVFIESVIQFFESACV